MKTVLSVLASLVLSWSAFAEDEVVESADASICTIQVEVTGVVGAATYDHLQRAQERAKSKNCSSLLVLINTPGGSLQTTRMIVEEILNSEIPYLCLVHPSGGHAGSAGAIILQACHIAGAMKATNLGAATPVSGGGQEMPEDLKKKIFNDTISWLEGITKLRKRSLEFSKEIITEAKAVDAEEALKLGAIDAVVTSKEEFLKFAADKTITLSNEKKSKVVVGGIVTFDKDLRSQVLELVADPQTAYLMFMGSLGLLYFELTHPGMIVPGVVGAIGLVVSMVSLHKLNVEWGGVLLIFLGIALMIAEVFVSSFGALGLGGVAAFIVGSIFMFDQETSGHTIPLSMILPTAIVLGLLMLGVSYLAAKTFKVKNKLGFEGLVGQTGEVQNVDEAGLNGQMFVHGEIWKFKSKHKVSVNDQVKVVDHKGLTLSVQKENES